MQVVKYAFQQHGGDRGQLVALEEYQDIFRHFKKMIHFRDKIADTVF